MKCILIFCLNSLSHFLYLQDYVCPRCNSGFIEELERTHVSDSDSSSDTEMEPFDMLDLIAQEPPTIPGASASPASSSSVPGPRISQRLRHLNARHNRRRLAALIKVHMDHILMVNKYMLVPLLHESTNIEVLH